LQNLTNIHESRNNSAVSLKKDDLITSISLRPNEASTIAEQTTQDSNCPETNDTAAALSNLPLSLWCLKLTSTSIFDISTQIFYKVNIFAEVGLYGESYELYSDEINSHNLRSEMKHYYNSEYVHFQRQISPNRRSLVVDAMVSYFFRYH